MSAVNQTPPRTPASVTNPEIRRSSRGESAASPAETMWSAGSERVRGATCGLAGTTTGRSPGALATDSPVAEVSRGDVSTGAGDDAAVAPGPEPPTGCCSSQGNRPQSYSPRNRSRATTIPPAIRPRTYPTATRMIGKTTGRNSGDSKFPRSIVASLIHPRTLDPILNWLSYREIRSSLQRIAET